MIQGGLGLVIESNARAMWSKLPNAELLDLITFDKYKEDVSDKEIEGYMCKIC